MTELSIVPGEVVTHVVNARDPESALLDMHDDIRELLAILRPLAPAIAQLPALLAQAQSVEARLPDIVAQLNNSPVLRMFGVKL